MMPPSRILINVCPDVCGRIYPLPVYIILLSGERIFSRAIAFENQKTIMEVQEEIISSWWVQ
ncbi:hypothetical protein, partial [Candidatus Magnetaquicoccus inordinatus]|uniref:hypothetical protein n=1 Tax=Candidatus Magnetaquicoccus inordinatus TaxID=2496818 RepID=UPI001D0DD592